MESIKVCRICLNSATKLYECNKLSLKAYYEEVIGYRISLDDGLPQYFCVECATLLCKFHEFGQKCRRSSKFLYKLSNDNMLKSDTDFNNARHRFKLFTMVSHMQLTKRVGAFYYVEDNFIKKCDTNDDSAGINCIEKTAVEPLVKNEIVRQEIEFDGDNESAYFESDAHVSDTENQVISKPNLNNKNPLLQKKIIRRKPVKKKEIVKAKVGKKKKIQVDNTKWKTVILSEDEARKEFEAKKEKDGFIRAPYKCMKCYKGSSSEEILNRHVFLVHRESLGDVECDYCKRRFKSKPLMKSHLRRHTHRFHCLRCPTVEHNSDNLKIHENKHDGVKFLCKFCGQQYSHSSTYYTHLRVIHRSQHICNICGVSFVSGHGLNMHQKMKHMDGLQPENTRKEDEEESKQMHCEKCNITFNNESAYSEHLYHSEKHKDDVKTDKHHKCKNIPIYIENKTRSVMAKVNRPPKRGTIEMNTSCRLCGYKFSRRQDCVNHYKTEHPDIPFTSKEKLVCDICGVSIASGNIGVHVNRHTHAREYPCTVCGRIFYDDTIRKKHTVVHTGEKPYGCKMCDKAFTQKSSLYLHRQTVHLKKPQPKRNRKKVTKTSPKTLPKDEVLEILKCLDEYIK